MALFPETQFDFPNCSAYDSDLRELIDRMRKLSEEMHNFLAVNKITNAGAWDITKQYAPWTVVSSNNAGYISFKPVPAGIEITNIEYWGLIADYNILITDLSHKISVLENDVATLENTTIPEINNHLTRIDNYIDSQTARNIVFIGDSFGTLRNSANKTMFQLAAEYIGCAHTYINSISSRGFATTPAFIDQLADIYTAVEDPTTITDIVVCGGPNDGQFTSTQIDAAIASFCSYAKEHFPNANIYIGCEGASQNLHVRYVDRLRVLPTYKECYKYGAKYLHGLEFVLIPKYQESDGLHPLPAGVDILGRHIADAFLNGQTVARYLFEITPNDFTLNTTNCNSVTFSANSTLALGINGDTAFYGTDMLGAININMGGKGWQNGTEYEIGTISLDKMPFLTYDGKTQFQGAVIFGSYYHSPQEDVTGYIKFRIFQNSILITPLFSGHNISQSSGAIGFTIPNVSIPSYLG